MHFVGQLHHRQFAGWRVFEKAAFNAAQLIVIAVTTTMSFFKFADGISSLFFPAMVHADNIVSVAGLPRMSFQAGLLKIAACFAVVRLLGACRGVHAE